MKKVIATAYQFDSLPGHVMVSAAGEGLKIKVAIQRAVEQIMQDPRVRGRHINSFKLAVVVSKATGGKTDA